MVFQKLKCNLNQITGEASITEKSCYEAISENEFINTPEGVKSMCEKVENALQTILLENSSLMFKKVAWHMLLLPTRQTSLLKISRQR